MTTLITLIAALATAAATYLISRRKPRDLRDGEEPYLDQAIIPTPGQWIWRWNRATAEQRLSMASSALALADQAQRVRMLTLRWADAEPLIPGQALAELRHALAGDPEPQSCQNVRVGDRLIRVTGARRPTPRECRAVAALLEANDHALGRTVLADQPDDGGAP